jgi:hypothetical protein
MSGSFQELLSYYRVCPAGECRKSPTTNTQIKPELYQGLKLNKV